jgi:glycosyltransferase involved in cell wall biosynthesis
LVLAGGALYHDRYTAELHRHASDRIRFLDYVSGEPLQELLTNAMLFVLPSDLEGLSLALLEAMGAGLCVLASDIPENREVVEGAGFLFGKGDAADLAGMLRFLAASPEVRAEAGRRAQERIRELYDWDRITDAIADQYQGIAGQQFLPRPATRALSDTRKDRGHAA